MIVLWYISVFSGVGGVQPFVPQLLYDSVGETEQQMPALSTGLGRTEDRQIELDIHLWHTSLDLPMENITCVLKITPKDSLKELWQQWQHFVFQTVSRRIEVPKFNNHRIELIYVYGFFPHSSNLLNGLAGQSCFCILKLQK